MSHQYIDEFWDDYIEDCRRNIVEYRKALAKFEEDKNDAHLYNLFGVVHSIKGSALTVGVDHIVKVTHQLESTLEKLKSINNLSSRQLSPSFFFFEELIQKTIDNQVSDIVESEEFKEYFNQVHVNTSFKEQASEEIEPPSQTQEPMIQLMYISKKSPDVRLFDIIEFSSKAKSNNNSAKIGGMLIYFRGHFMQLLEGPTVEVNQLFNKIIRDERHYDVELMDVSTIHSRRFGAWSLNNISAASYMKLHELMVGFGVVKPTDAFPRHYEMLNLIVEKLKVDPEGIY